MNGKYQVGSGRVVTFTHDTPFIDTSISDFGKSVKRKQLDIINATNPAPNSYSTWIRSVDDIKTLSETLEDSDWEDEAINPDLTRSEIRRAIKKSNHNIYTKENVNGSPESTNQRAEAGHITADTNKIVTQSSSSVNPQISPTAKALRKQKKIFCCFCVWV